MRLCLLPALAALFLGNAFAAETTNTVAPEITLELRDYATMPITGKLDGTGQIMGLLARANFMREEPVAAKKRVFINDLNGPLYILDKQSGKFTTYLDFNGRDGRPGLFHRLPWESGFANGFVCFTFDPDYAHNGKFYTIHLEDPEVAASALPDSANFPGLKPGYEVTPAIQTPGPTVREAVVIEWTDTDISNTTIEGTAREIMRLRLNTQIHPMGDLMFNPTARPGSPDWRVMYIACGDSGSGESKNLEMRSNPQRLDTMVGKILRIIPDLSVRKGSSTVSDNGRYRIPDDNPFVAKKPAGVRGEIWAYGIRNPARLTWDVDPLNPKDSHLIANVIGLNTWETAIFIHKGANYGYSLREGNEELLVATNKTGPLPADDKIPVRLNATETDGTVVPVYPIIQYPHLKGGGDAISSGYVYRGKAIPALRGKYIFGDISTGGVWYADYKEMLAADAGKAKRPVAMHPMRIRWGKSSETSEIYSSMSPITELVYHARGGKAKGLPGFGAVAGGGRSDIHFWADSEGELYVISKSDGMIRKVVSASVAKSATSK